MAAYSRWLDMQTNKVLHFSQWNEGRCLRSTFQQRLLWAVGPSGNAAPLKQCRKKEQTKKPQINGGDTWLIWNESYFSHSLRVRQNCWLKSMFAFFSELASFWQTSLKYTKCTLRYLNIMKNCIKLLNMKSYVTFTYKILKILKLKTKLEYISKLLLFKFFWDLVPYPKVRRKLSL